MDLFSPQSLLDAPQQKPQFPTQSQQQNMMSFTASQFDLAKEREKLKEIEKYRKNLEKNEILNTKSSSNSSSSGKSLMCTDEEIRVLRENNELLTKRIQSLEEIISMQSQQIAKENETIFKAQPQANDLLKNWREKVFSLLLQLKTQEIVMKEQDSYINKMETIHTEKCKKLELELKISKQRESDLQSQIQFENNTSKKTSTTALEKLSKMEKIFKEEVNQMEISKSCIFEMLNHFKTEVFNKKLNEIEQYSSKLVNFEKKISFIRNRIQFCDGFLKKKSVAQEEKLNFLENQKKNLKETLNKSSVLISQFKNAKQVIQTMEKEIDTLKQERDNLLNNPPNKIEHEKYEKAIRELSERLKKKEMETETLIDNLRNEFKKKEENMEKEKFKTLEANLLPLKQEMNVVKQKISNYRAILAKKEEEIKSMSSSKDKIEKELLFSRLQALELEKKLNHNNFSSNIYNPFGFTAPKQNFMQSQPQMQDFIPNDPNPLINEDLFQIPGTGPNLQQKKLPKMDDFGENGNAGEPTEKSILEKIKNLSFIAEGLLGTENDN